MDRYIRMLLKYLNRDEFENILVCSFDFKKEDYDGLVIAFEQIATKRAISISDFKAISKVRKLIRNYKPDIVYAHSSKAGAIARIADIGIRNSCIYNAHGWAFNMQCSRKKQFIYMLIEKFAAPFCKKIVCISETEKKSALDKKICENRKLHVILNGVDIEAYESAKHGQITREELNIPNDALVIGMVGRISKQKSPDVFIKTAGLIKQKIPNAHFIIVGNGDMENEIIEMAQKNGIYDSLHITGWVNMPMKYVELFDIAMLLSRWEGFGLVLPEYMMAGKPIVASRVDAIPDIISDHKNGLLVPVDNPIITCEAVMEIYKKPGLQKYLVEQGNKIVYMKYNARRVSIEHEKLFRNIIKC